MRIGVTVPVAEEENYQASPYSQIRAIAQSADSASLDSIWAADHLLYQRDPDVPPRRFWESWTLLAALAEATERVELGHLVSCVPFRNAGLTAFMANTLDEISGGRFVLGVGSGWHYLEFNAFGFEFERRASVYEESLAVIVPLLRGETVDYAGEFVTGRATLGPRGPRPTGPPILTASKGPRMHRLSAQYADRWNTAWYGHPAEPFWERREGLHAACAAIGRDPAEIEVNVGLNVLDEAAIGDMERSRLLVAEPAAIADGFAAWHEQGVAEVICRLEPATPEMVERVARAAEILRRR